MDNGQKSIQQLMRKKLIEFRTRNPSFSIRAFAKRLKMQPSAANEILKGERRVSRKLALRISDALHLSPDERENLLAQFPIEKKTTQVEQSKKDEQTQLQLSADQFELISNWVHFAILNLVTTEEFKNDVNHIAGRLNVSRVQVVKALDRLRRLKLLTVDSEGGLKRTYQRIQTSDDVLNLSIQKAHLEDFELAKEALLQVPIEARDFTSITLPIAPHLLSRAKKAIRNAQDEIAEMLASEPTTEVYRMCSYFFPLSKPLVKQSETKNQKMRNVR